MFGMPKGSNSFSAEVVIFFFSFSVLSETLSYPSFVMLL